MSTLRYIRCNQPHYTRIHAVAVLSVALFVPLYAQGTAPDCEYLDKLAQNLSRKFPGLAATEIRVSVQPRCPAEQVQFSSVRSNAFGGSTLTLRCAGSNGLPFTASVAPSLPKSERVVNKAPLLRSGTRVRLEIASQGFTVITTAITLGAGDIGDSITVRATRTNRIFSAQVLNSSTLRATLRENRQ